jgi:hypothetical protein
MTDDIICINSDSVNRYGIVFHIIALEKSLKEIYQTGTPMLIGHDIHRPVGWNLPFGIFIESKLARVMSRKLIAETREEREQIFKALQRYVGKNYRKRFEKYEDAFLPLISFHLTGGETRIDTGCVAVVDDRLAVKLFPALFESVDKDALIDVSLLLKDFQYLGQGVFCHRPSKLCVFAHEYFRRSQSRLNNFHFFFLDAFMDLANSANCTLRIRLDRDMVGYGPSYHERGELAFHFGPPYTDDIEKIKPGITRHVNTETERLFHGISATEFYWKNEGQEKVFELEELRDNPSPANQENFHCRYIHSIYDTTEQHFRHFDGAMRSYDMDMMLDRVDKDFISWGRKSNYEKLFRIDGSLPLHKWKSLITHYMQGNALVYEYFGMKKELASFEIKERDLTPYEKILPFAISEEEGVKLMVSYHELPKDLKPGRYIDVYDIMGDDQENFFIVEHLIMEVKNAFLLAGEEFGIREDIKYVKIDDPFWNIPSMMHGGPDSSELLHKSVDILIKLFTALKNKGSRTAISLTLSFEFNGRLVRFSTYGLIYHQIEWLKKSFPLEFTETALTNWVVNQREYVNQFEETSNTPLLGSLLQKDGILLINRIPMTYPYHLEEDEKGMKIRFEFPESDRANYELFQKNLIRPVLAFSIEKAIWSDSKENYFTASRSKWMEETDGQVEIHEATPLGVFWSKP